MLATLSGFTGLYAAMVCVACSQLEKLRTTLLDINQKQETTGQGRMFSLMQAELNACIRHHQKIKG
jgi:hypothetical protein